MNIQKNFCGAVFFDVDGTLVDEKHHISVPTNKTKEAIARLKQNGYLTGIATGRARCYIPKSGIDFDCYVSCNGAVAEIGDEVIFNSCIETEKLTDLVQYLIENDFAFDVETYKRCFYGSNKTELMLHALEVFSISQECFEPLGSIERLKTINANKVMIMFDDDEKFKKLRRDFEGEYLVDRHRSNSSADISKFGITKAVGIDAIINHFGISHENTYAFGDGRNDIDMLRTVGCGIAMTPHSSVLDGVCKYVTGGVKDEGIYNALCKLNLI